MASEDESNIGMDRDGIWYVKDFIKAAVTKYPKPQERVAVLWAGGSVSADDFRNIGEFIETYTAGQGKTFLDVFDIETMTGMGLNGLDKNQLWWRAINRALKAFAAVASGDSANVYMNPNSCRNLFSPPSKNPQDSDPEHGGQATNWEIWYYAELPTLMRNLNVNKVISFYMTKRSDGQSPRFMNSTQWDSMKVGSF